MTTERVLVVDDSEANRLVATGHLEAAGYEVVAVECGEDALVVLQDAHIDLVVLDVLMPGLGGFATCRRIRMTPAVAETPVLFLTALGDREATQPALDAGGDDLLAKPFLRAELLLRVKSLIRSRRTTDELRQALRALADQNEQLRRVEHDKRKMSELIIHDLKGPITGVMANAELLRDAVDMEEVLQITEEIVVAASVMDRTARDLLDLSRAEEGTLQPSIEPFDLAELATEVVASLGGLARWSGLTIELDIGVKTAIADRELTRRILANLVHNAVKYAPHGTGIQIAARRDADELELRVSDDGPGVPVDEAEHIFARGVTLATEPTRSGSHGLGLAFCLLATEAHGGKIWVEARLPHGASFCVRIPQPAAASEPAERA
jgi:two-component system, sensor histidine kinase and response regulator